MNGKLKNALVGLSIFGLAVILGCASVMDVMTPSHISPIAKDYMDANDVPLPPFKRLIPWWDSLFDLRVIAARIEFIHQYREMDEDLRYEFAVGTNRFFITGSEKLQQTLFSPEGPIGLLLPTVFGGTLGALLIKRPGDKSKKELESA